MEKSAEVSRVSESRTLSPLSFSPFRIDFFFFCTIVSLDRVAFNRKIFRIFDTYGLRYYRKKYDETSFFESIITKISGRVFIILNL